MVIQRKNYNNENRMTNDMEHFTKKSPNICQFRRNVVNFVDEMGENNGNAQELVL